MRNLTARSGNKKPDAPFFIEGGGDIAVLGALCLFLSALDHIIPKPLPFMRLGLANFPLLIALGVLSARNFFLLVLVKVLGQALVSGTLFSYVVLFSLAGTILSALAMLLLYRVARGGLSLVGTSIAGAFVSNAAQLFLARFLVFGEGILYLAPPFLTAGIVSGGLLGFFAEQFSAGSEWLRLTRAKAAANGAVTKAVAADDAAKVEPPEGTAADTTVTARDKIPASGGGFAMVSAPTKAAVVFRYAGFFALAAFFLLVPNLSVRAALFVLFWILAIVSEKKTRPLFTLFGIAAITVCNLFPPFGKILFSAGPFVIAEGSLLRGLQRAVTMEGLVMFSKAALLSIPRLPGKTGKLLRESFAILDRMNEVFFSGNRKAVGTNNKKRLLERLDDLLCEVSGYQLRRE
jgi:heptaprenyl diphosphate synthase